MAVQLYTAANKFFIFIFHATFPSVMVKGRQGENAKLIKLGFIAFIKARFSYMALVPGVIT